jgi:lipopolysaccharide transport system ATP-binding protein
VQAGEVFGVIGRNGAGKSTMLKVVSRVLRPTKGRVRVIGRVAPLLELGAAFHHELTGRENVFLNAALLGRTQRQVEERFQEIVDFADIGGFIDAPLRTYSTGMVARLGFSVATAWEPDILVLDEVLAVGDEAFQAKCHERINSFREDGATVLLVSHNTRVVQEICQRVAWIDQGVIRAIGDPEEIVQMYREG